MKKHIFGIFSMLMLLSSLASCQKELMGYEGKDCLYFNVRRGAAHIEQSRWGHQFFTDVAFGTMMDKSKDLELEITCTGEIKNYDRPFKVTIAADSTTAVSGRDFTGLQPEYVIKAGETSTLVKLTVNRTAEMEDDTLHLQLKLEPNEHFDLNFTNFGHAPGLYDGEVNRAFDYNKDASVHNLFFYDVLSMPRGADGLTSSGGWWGNDKGGNGLGLFGNFSPKKFKLIMELTGTTVDDFSSKKVMPSPRANAISQTVALYLLEMAKSRDTVVLEDDGTMMYVSYVSTLGGSKAWAPFTRPEAYFK